MLYLHDLNTFVLSCFAQTLIESFVFSTFRIHKLVMFAKSIEAF